MSSNRLVRPVIDRLLYYRQSCIKTLFHTIPKFGLIAKLTTAYKSTWLPMAIFRHLLFKLIVVTENHTILVKLCMEWLLNCYIASQFYIHRVLIPCKST